MRSHIRTLTLFIGTGIVGLGCADEPPVRLTGIASVYCTDTTVLKAKLHNPTEKSLFVSVSIDKKSQSGDWEEYAADINANEPYPRKVISVSVASGRSRDLEWRPPTRGTGEPLSDGTYRVMTYVTKDFRSPGKKYAVAQFSVSREACDAPTR